MVLAAMAARDIGRPVKLALTRAHMFGSVGFRPRTEQQLTLGANANGELTAFRHDSISQTSVFDEFVEPSAATTRMLYACPNLDTSHRVVRLDYGTPTYMRAPGESSGSFALESAMDEMAYSLGMDPVQFRLKNYAEVEPQKNLPWSSKSLRQCYQAASEAFGWSKRQSAPRSMTASDGRLIGWGMATATYPTNRSEASALARIMPDGSAYVQAGSQDLGTGTYTIMTQIAADALGLSPSRVRFELGDTRMPNSPGSWRFPNCGKHEAQLSTTRPSQCEAKAIELEAIADQLSPLHGLVTTDVDVRDGRLYAVVDPTKADGYADLIARHSLPNIEATIDTKPGTEKEQYAMHSFGAIFTEVLVDPQLCEIRLNRVVGAYAAGHILNAKTGRSQFIGGIIFGIGMALMEETIPDPNVGRIVNRDLAEYHVPVNADVPDIQVIVVDEDDPHINPIGAKGIGEIGIVVRRRIDRQCRLSRHRYAGP